MKLVIAVLCMAPVMGLGQGTPSPTPWPSREPMWRCDLPGGTYEVGVRNIISVSIHDYVVDGVARVTEMNIETPGSTEVRFYYLEPVVGSSPLGIGQSTLERAKELATEVAGQANPGDQPPWEKVVKSYPTTTHAHTVEFRLNSQDDLQTLFKSAEQAFRMQQNTEITLEGGVATSSGAGAVTGP
jgi:hypothetical protein